jgi:hypothetical protein
MPTSDPADVIARVCDAIHRSDLEGARGIARQEYAFVPQTSVGRRYTEQESLRVFLRDGFVDRYSGTRLVFPGTLRILSQLLPDELPAHPNWKMSESHLMFWELFPTIDHVAPVARGGPDEESNWVTTSMLHNQAKANWTLEELGWTLRPVEAGEDWDGLLEWFLQRSKEHPMHLQDPYLRRWHRAVRAVTSARHSSQK